jgi:hypothetical protein
MKNMMVSTSFWLSLYFAINAWTVFAEPSNMDGAARMKEQLSKVQKKGEPIDIDIQLERFEALKADFSKEIELKKMECAGEFRVIEIGEDEKQTQVIKKLSKEERNVCLKKLKLFLNSYTRDIFEIRKLILSFYTKQYQMQLQDAQKKEMIKLESIVKKQRKRKR